jgi:hypothetical protein
VSEHTPGPWKIQYGGINDWDEGFGVAGTLVGHTHIVAECWPPGTDQARRQQLLADARLIAAAPKLLAACKIAVCHMRDRDPDKPAVIAAIAEAEGKPA